DLRPDDTRGERGAFEARGDRVRFGPGEVEPGRAFLTGRRADDAAVHVTVHELAGAVRGRRADRVQVRVKPFVTLEGFRGVHSRVRWADRKDDFAVPGQRLDGAQVGQPGFLSA